MSAKIPFIILKIDNHFELKDKILNSINSMEKNKYMEISHTDWNRDKDYDRPYYDFVKDMFNNILETVNGIYKYPEKFKLGSYWFQQYINNNTHDWHVHQNCLFSCVYYVEASNETPVTTFKLFNEEFDINVNEGEVLIFPSFLLHCSKPNNSNKRKTIISFNLM